MSKVEPAIDLKKYDIKSGSAIASHVKQTRKILSFNGISKLLRRCFIVMILGA